MKTLLVLEDGKTFEGQAFGAPGEACGEVVFNTSMMGYQEILTDPSYRGQMVAMTYPLIGNYGVNSDDVESGKVWAEGFIVREGSRVHSNWRSKQGLEQYLEENGVVGIQGIDTRALTRHIRAMGSMKGIISNKETDRENLAERAKSSAGIVGRDLAAEVTCKGPYQWTEAPWKLPGGGRGNQPRPQKSRAYKVVAYDFGAKRNILRKLVETGCSVHVAPASASWEEVLALEPDGIFLSNGPGDPEGVPYAAENIRRLIGKKPIFGICLGHQLLALAFGLKTYKLRFGHHGGNHPVKDLKTGKIEITSQNHCFSIKEDDIPGFLDVTHVNLNDRTIEGIRHKELPIFSVQYHPEASPGPQDSAYLFQRFIEMMDSSK